VIDIYRVCLRSREDPGSQLRPNLSEPRFLVSKGRKGGSRKPQKSLKNLPRNQNPKLKRTRIPKTLTLEMRWLTYLLRVAIAELSGGVDPLSTSRLLDLEEGRRLRSSLSKFGECRAVGAPRWSRRLQALHAHSLKHEVKAPWSPRLLMSTASRGMCSPGHEDASHTRRWLPTALLKHTHPPMLDLLAPTWSSASMATHD
jgi:hypothetical protein